MTKISVVIPTFGREQELVGTVESLLVQTRNPFEIIVMDQNNPAIEAVDLFLAKHPIVRHLRNHEAGHVRNYNKCFEAAKGDVVLFLDDDVIAQKNLIENLMHVYDNDAQRKIACVAGRVLNPVGDLLPEKIKKVGSFNFWLGEPTTNFNYNQSCYVEFAQGAQMSFRREKLYAVKAFDEVFIGNAYFFETDACMRIADKGYKILFSPLCEVTHLMAPRGGGRVSDKALHTYYFIRNGTLLEKRHAFYFQWPVYFAWKIAYIVLKAVYNRSFNILWLGFKGLVDGIMAKSI